jgi:hypothetical protein
MAVASADQDGPARRERSKRWCCAWPKKTEIGATGVSRAHYLIWDTKWHAAHQGLANRLIVPEAGHLGNTGTIQRRQRLGGMLNYILPYSRLSSSPMSPLAGR